LTSRKGQIWTADFTSGIVVLTLVVLLFLLSWNSLAARWNSSNEYRQMQTDAILASEALMTTSGYPPSWEMGGPLNASNISAMGLVNGRNELNRFKIEKLVAENESSYYMVRERLGVQRYELGIRITDLERETTLYEYGRFGGGLESQVTFERMGILEGTPVIVQVEVWG
jgi:hypothetical protein